MPIRSGILPMCSPRSVAVSTSVTDIADVVILGRLFTRLFELGVVMVATRMPSRTNFKDGLNRAVPAFHRCCTGIWTV